MSDWGERWQTIGLERDGEIIAACVFNLYTGHDIAIHVAASELPRRFLRACFGYAFLQLNCRRVTAYLAQRNSNALRLVERLGYRYEGILRNALPDDSILIFGMLREECRHL